MRILATISALVLAANCFGQFQFDRSKISVRTAQIVHHIGKVNQLMGSAVYLSGMRPAQYDNFEALRKQATAAELKELTEHPNGVVRCYAFWALSHVPDVELLPIVVAHIPDTARVKTQFGCLGGTEQVGDFFISVVSPGSGDLASRKLTEAESEHLDSVLIHTPNALYARGRAIGHAKLTEQFHARMQELVVTDNDQAALVALARFNRKQDIPLILKAARRNKAEDLDHFTYQAISQFPDEAFFPFLVGSLNTAMRDKGGWRTEWRPLYAAIASFRNDEALRLLRLPFTQVSKANIRDYHLNFLFEAIQRFPAPVYDELLWTLWEDEMKVNVDVYQFLYPLDPERAFQSTLRTVENADAFRNLDATYSEKEAGDRQMSLLGMMLDTLIAKDRAKALELIGQHLRNANVHQFPVFAEKAQGLNEASFAEVILDRLQAETNPHVYLKATQVLLSLNDASINDSLLGVVGTNTALSTGWGGEALDRLLRQGGLR